jgi:hypothetical protein
MMFGLPVTKTEAANFDCGDFQHRYMILLASQKKKWIRAAGGDNGAIRLSQPADASAIQINTWDEGTQAYARCAWIDKDPFDS